MDRETEKNLRQALGVILGQNEGNLSSSLKELDALVPQMEGHLAHYLKKRSYTKAMAYLDGAEPEEDGGH